MKKITLIAVVLLGFVWQGWGQEISEEEKKKAKDLFITMNTLFKEENAKYGRLQEEFAKFKNDISINSLNTLTEKLHDKKVEIQASQKILDSIKADALAYEIYFTKEKTINKDSIHIWIEDIMNYTREIIDDENNTSNKIEVFTYFGNDKVINKDILENKTGIEAEILKDVLINTGEESYLGDITIPKENQEFYFYNHHDEMSNKKFKFKKLDIEIRDGYFFDIRAFIETDDGNLHVFTNQVGISLLFWKKRSN